MGIILFYILVLVIYSLSDSEFNNTSFYFKIEYWRLIYGIRVKCSKYISYMKSINGSNWMKKNFLKINTEIKMIINHSRWSMIVHDYRITLYMTGCVQTPGTYDNMADCGKRQLQFYIMYVVDTDELYFSKKSYCIVILLLL